MTDLIEFQAWPDGPLTADEAFLILVLASDATDPGLLEAAIATARCGRCGDPVVVDGVIPPPPVLSAGVCHACWVTSPASVRHEGGAHVEGPTEGCPFCERRAESPIEEFEDRFLSAGIEPGGTTGLTVVEDPVQEFEVAFYPGAFGVVRAWPASARPDNANLDWERLMTVPARSAIEALQIATA